MRFYILYLRPALAQEGEYSTAKWVLWSSCPNEGLQTGEAATDLIRHRGIENGYYRIVQSMAMVSPRGPVKPLQIDFDPWEEKRKVYFVPEE